ncbi:hypothetical protein NP493_87g04019 [Ridgeia piscesae]|uniref:Uncharacterized protein n=1 Tax=Ridgeia piscesae TaxID=27915 RepID=A0AAD9P8L5_RIDPI|nr:hypothetical protein NP493_87g04019 [Ridgeia piscesae]
MKAALVEAVEDLEADVVVLVVDSVVDAGAVVPAADVVRNATSVTGMGILRVNAARSRIVATSATSSVTSLRIAARALMQVHATTVANPATYSETAPSRATSRATSAVMLVTSLVTARTRVQAAMTTVASATTVARQATSRATAPSLAAMMAATSPSAIGVERLATLRVTAPTEAAGSRACSRSLTYIECTLFADQVWSSRPLCSRLPQQ